MTSIVRRSSAGDEEAQLGGVVYEVPQHRLEDLEALEQVFARFL